MRPESNALPQSPASDRPNGSSPHSVHKAALTGSSLNGSSPRRTDSNGLGPAAGTNGTSAAAAAATHAEADSTPESFYGHDREEVTRLMIQALSDLGYHSAASSLSQESGYDLETPHAAAFRTAVLNGNWSEAESLLSQPLPLGDARWTSTQSNGRRRSSQPADAAGAATKSYSGGLALAPDADRDEMLFLIRQQKYLELLERRDLGAALMVLRQELQPLHQDERLLHGLSGLIMCQSSDDLKNQANWDGALGQSRKQLLTDLSRSISPSVMIPEQRLAQLLRQVQDYQVQNEPYANNSYTPSLYADYTAERADFPLTPVMVLDDHKDEVWCLQFSNDGTRLATASADKMIVIYDTNTFRPIHELKLHTGQVAYVAWSPDDTKLLTCSHDKQARLWDTRTGTCIRILASYAHHPVTTAAFAPDGLTCVTGSMELKDSLCVWNVDDTSPTSTPIFTFPLEKRIQDCALGAVLPAFPAGSASATPALLNHAAYAADATLPVRLVAISTEKEVHIFDYVSRQHIGVIQFGVDMTSIALSRDGREMLVNLGCNQVWSMSVEERGTGKVRQVFPGQVQSKFVIRGCYGGASEGVVMSGSEDSRIYIWHRHTGRLLERLDAHTTGCVNAVAWNTAKPIMFASAGDDHKVRIWAKAPVQRDQSTPHFNPLSHWTSGIGVVSGTTVDNGTVTNPANGSGNGAGNDAREEAH